MHETEAGDRFEQFWRAYPRRVGKGAARKAWQRLRPSEALTHKMLQALEWQRTQPQWTRDGGEYIPHPSTWLNQERWEDEPVEVAPEAPRMTRGRRVAEHNAAMFAAIGAIPKDGAA